MNQSAFPRFRIIVALLVVGALSWVYKIRHQAPAQPATAAQAATAVALLAVTRCGQLAGYVAVYSDGSSKLYPPVHAKPGTRFTAIETGGNCGGVVL